MDVKHENIDWEEYWFSEYRKRTPDEIVSLEKEIKKDLLKKAEEFLKRTPECKKTAQEIADEKWDNEFDRFEWQREMRSEEYHESNIDKLFTQVFYELLKNSELIIKSSDEKAEVKDRCYTQFFDRIKDQLKDKASGVPAIYIPLHDHEGMKRLVRTFILDFEPRLVPNDSINELVPNDNVTDDIEKLGLSESELRSLIKNRIGFLIDENLKIKRGLVSVEEKIALINKYAARIYEGVNNNIVSDILKAEMKKIDYKEPTENELIKLIDEILVAHDDRFSIPEYTDHEDGKKEIIEHGQLKKICANIYEKLLNEKMLELNTVETKNSRGISEKVIPWIEKQYLITNQQKESAHTYFRKRTIEAKKTETGIEVIVHKY